MNRNLPKIIYEILRHDDLQEKEVKKIRTYSATFLASAIAGGLSWAFAGTPTSESMFPDLLILSSAFLLIAFVATLGRVVVLTHIMSTLLSLLGISLLYIGTVLVLQGFLTRSVFIIASSVGGIVALVALLNIVLSLKGILRFAEEILKREYVGDSE